MPRFPSLLLTALLLPAANAAGVELQERLEAYAALANLPAIHALDDDDYAELADGEAVVWMAETPANDDDEVRSMGVIGVRVVEAPRLLVWLSVMGGTYERDSRLTAVALDRGEDGSYTRYQHIDLPWPVKNRHWLIHCEKNPALAEATDGGTWEHRWELVEDGDAVVRKAFASGRIDRLDDDTPDETVYLPANRGAWALFDLGDKRTLVLARLDADLGGYFPDPVVRAFTRRQLRAGLEKIDDLTRRVHLSYAGEPMIHDGFGRPVLPAVAQQVAADWAGARRLATAPR